MSDSLYKFSFGCCTRGSKNHPPVEAKQTNFHGFLLSCYWPDYVSHLPTLW